MEILLIIIAINVIPRIIKAFNSSEANQGSQTSSSQPQSSLKSLVESLMEEANVAPTPVTAPAPVVKKRPVLKKEPAKIILEEDSFQFGNSLEEEVKKAEKILATQKLEESEAKEQASSYFKDKEDLKRAFIAKEILGTPVSMR